VRSTWPFSFFGWYVNPLSPSDNIGSTTLVGATACIISAAAAWAASAERATM